MMQVWHLGKGRDKEGMDRKSFVHCWGIFCQEGKVCSRRPLNNKEFEFEGPLIRGFFSINIQSALYILWFFIPGFNEPGIANLIHSLSLVESLAKEPWIWPRRLWADHGTWASSDFGILSMSWNQSPSPIWRNNCIVIISIFGKKKKYEHTVKFKSQIDLNCKASS